MRNAGISAPGGSSRIAGPGPAHVNARRANRSVSKGSTVLVITSSPGQGSIGRQAAFNNVPSLGTFYVVADTSYTHHPVWNIRVDLKPGSNSITLDEGNRRLSIDEAGICPSDRSAGAFRRARPIGGSILRRSALAATSNAMYRPFPPTKRIEHRQHESSFAPDAGAVGT